MAQEFGWQRLLQHDGYVVVRLRLLGSEESGSKVRPIQAGFRADWIIRGGLPTRAPLTFVEPERRSLKPGDEAVVRVHPFQPSAWRRIPEGAEVTLGWKPGRSLGTATVLQQVRLPDVDPPLRLPRLRPGQVLATAYRADTLRSRLRNAVRLLGRRS